MNVFERIVRWLRWINPMLIVAWQYREKDALGTMRIRNKGTTYLWRCWLMVGALWVANFLIVLTGVEHNESDFFIVDA